MSLAELTRQLDRVAVRGRRVGLLRCLSLFWVLAALAALAWLLGGKMSGRPPHAAVWIPMAAASTIACLVLFWVGNRRSDVRGIARQIERFWPDLNARLLAAIEQRPDPKTGQWSFLQQQLFAEVLDHADRHDWRQAIPTGRLVRSICLQVASLGFLAVVVSILSGFDMPLLTHRSAKLPLPMGDELVIVEPGDVSVERGTALVVLAHFRGKLPRNVTIVASDSADGRTRIPLARSLDDPLFGGRIPLVERDTTYYVEYDGGRTQDFHVTVFEYPQLLQADADVVFPAYTGLPPTEIKDTRRLNVVEGSTVTLTCRLNKPVASAFLVGGSAGPLRLDRSSDRADILQVSLRSEASQRYRLELVDEEGRRNTYPPELVVEVAPNRRPELKPTFPARDLRVSPIEELSVEATAWDDFGLEAYGVVYTLAGSQPQEVVLGGCCRGNENCRMAHLLSFEELSAQPDQLLSYYFFADDVGPDGRVRRTFSDMYFAEVRHFEDVFRQGPQTAGGGAQQSGEGQAREVEEMARLQKEILNATWTLFRRDTTPVAVEPFPDDILVVKQSQDSVRTQSLQLNSKLDDRAKHAMLAAAVESMTRAVASLARAADERSVSELPAALIAEQTAYESLLKLRTREHRVARSQGGGGGGPGGNRSEQELDQLELSNHRNRYETERTSSADEPSLQNREMLQVLNRLRELARRQNNLNEKLKELEYALREAATDTEQQAVRRQLKRLREEQEQLLRDLDELRDRMGRPENQRQMAESRRQIEQTRSRVLQASEALQRGQVSKALASGTRAERALEELREDFRRKAAGQFADAVRQLRHDARELAQRQNSLAGELQEIQQQRHRSLRDSQDRRQTARGLSEQKQKLDGLFDQTRRVVEEAESNEPLLSKALYETLRKARDQQPGERLEAASQMLEQGLLTQANDMEQQARQGIESIKRGIEKAADAVLGSEVVSLKRARNELGEAAKALADEIEQADRANGPLTGGEFRQWSDRLRDAEELIEDPTLRTRVAEVRERARQVRIEFKRQSQEPNWKMVRSSIWEPLVELDSRLAEEVARRESQERLVPIDRDPVPQRFAELVRRYYEQLGNRK